MAEQTWSAPAQVGAGVPALPAGASFSQPGSRLGAALLEGLLAVVTLGIGWLVWSFVLWGKGTTPAKSILKMKVVDATGRPLTLGAMALRELLLKPIIGGWTLYIGYLWMLWDPNKQALYDKVQKTFVVADPNGSIAAS